jgi:hypothetical protein
MHDELGAWSVEPVELHRVFPLPRQAVAAANTVLTVSGADFIIEYEITGTDTSVRLFEPGRAENPRHGADGLSCRWCPVPHGESQAEAGRGAVGVAKRPASAIWRTR